MGWLLSIIARLTRAKDIYDWATFLDALRLAVESKLGISVVSGLGAALYATWAEATGPQGTCGTGRIHCASRVAILRILKKPTRRGVVVAGALHIGEWQPDLLYQFC